MNLFVCVDEELSILSLNFFKPFENTLLEIKNLLRNNVVVCDDEYNDYISLLPVCSKIILDEKTQSNLPDFFSPLGTTKEKIVGTQSELFFHLRRLQNKKIYVIGHNLIHDFLPLVTDVYQLNMLSKAPTPSQKFTDLSTNQHWKFVAYTEPVYENKRTFYFSHYKRKTDQKAPHNSIDLNL